MPSSLSHALSDIPLISFLTAHPNPVFIQHCKRHFGQIYPSLDIIYANSAFRSLLFGTDIEASELGTSFLKSLRTVEQGRKLTNWLDVGLTSDTKRAETLLLEVEIPWAPAGAPPVPLELTQTRLDEFVIITSSTRALVPKYAPPVKPSMNTTRPGRDFSMKLPDFPLPISAVNPSMSVMTPTAFTATMRTPTSSIGPSSRSPERNLESEDLVQNNMRDMIENHDWHLTPLGSRSSWPASLKAIMNYMLASPYPQSMWWGPEVVLVYNDAYKEMAGSKHPSIFAEKGSVSWGELWETLGPLADKAFKGETVAKSDDLLFFNRLTDANLPEETYHSWSFVPVEREDGTVGGIFNSNFESTSKVIAERRMLFLRDLGNRAGLARTQTEFAESVLEVLRQQSVDAPFAAFYFASVKGIEPAESRPRTSYLRKSIDDPPIRVELRRAGAVGIPHDHPSVPNTVELVLDPLTFRASPKANPRADSPIPSNHVQELFADNTISLQDGRAGGAGYESSSSASADTRSSSSISSSGASSSTAIPRASKASAIWQFDGAFSSRRPVHVQNIPDYIVEGFEIRGWGEHAREAVVIPIVVDNSDLPAAVLILGLNSRRPYDHEYSAWIELTHLSLNSLLTAVKGRESDLIRAEHLAELDSAKTAFFSNASHELRTPLTLIQGPLQDALGSCTDPRVKDSLKMASRNVVRLSRLVDSLMDFSKIAANRLEGRFRPIELGAYTADLASLFRSVMEKNRIEYIVECEVNERKICYVDPEFWEKIVFNLIGNAFKYTLSGSVHVKLEYFNNQAKLYVKDSGVGIPESDIDKIFDRFHRVYNTSRSHEGTGIGLSLTKELVKLHGGSITVTSVTESESPDNHGSCFIVTIPIGKDHLPAAHIIQQPNDLPQHRLYARGIVDEANNWTTRPPEERTPSEQSESSDSGGSSEGSRMDPSTLFFVKSDVILLVDDNMDMRKYIKSLFSPYCTVVEASNGQDALRVMDNIKPNLILSDVMMPILDGYGLISHVRRRPETRLTPIILITAKESEDAKVEGLLSGADDYMSKPFTGKEVIARVHLQMQLGKRRIELEAKFSERTREIQLLSDLSPVGIIRADVDGHILYVNPRWIEISGYSNTANIEAWPESVRDEDKDAVVEVWKSAVTAQKDTSLEFQFKNGTYAKGQFVPLMSESGAPMGVIGTLTDVSDQRLFEASRLAHAQEREALARKRAEDAEERRREADERRRGQELLIDVTSHELRQPVSAILNGSSLIRSNLASLREELARCHDSKLGFTVSESLLRVMDEDIDALDAIYQCGLAQERIANDVLSLSRIQLQILSIQPVDFDLVTEVRGIVSIFRNELKMKRINLELHFGKSLDKLRVTRIRSDKARFAQVITNLLSNGIKFTDTSTDRREIIVTVNVSRQAPGEDDPCIPPEGADDERPMSPDQSHKIFVFVSVQDSGPGLNPDDLALLFKRFQQGSNSHNVFGGSGLGLFVSRKLCDLMGGRIDVDSVYGEGATFRFFVQATTAGTSIPSRAGVGRRIVSNSSPSSSVPNVPSASRPLHVLITEDNIINQTVLLRQLKKAGCTAALASNGLQAIEQVKAMAAAGHSDPHERHQFDAILMDCEMPVMDGLTAVREIRKMEAAGELPCRNRIFALTGNARAGQVQSARDAGMDDVIIKPYKLNELLQKIADF